MAQHFKVEELLPAEELETLGKWIREANGTRTIDEVHERLQADGYTIGRTAVGNWLQKFREQLITERMQAGGGLARALMDAAKESGGVAVQDAALLQLSQLVFEQATVGEIAIDDLQKLALAMQRLSLSKKRVEDVRSEFIEREKLALEAASSVAKDGGDGRSVVDKVREILGVH